MRRAGVGRDGPSGNRQRSRRPTRTSTFGVSRRESHDAEAFYRRFAPIDESSDDDVASPRRVGSELEAPAALDRLFCGPAEDMTADQVAPASVALVVTSPPYFAGKEYEAALGQGVVPGSYIEYLAMLERVLDRCVEALEPGGRMAVNVANLGRKPYRSLSADVIGILQDRLGLLLRGEIIWVKAEGAAGSTAWGSYQSPTNPVLRDVTERIIVASKGRFDRARPPRRRRTEGLPHEATILQDDFLADTLDLWRFPPESATRVGHPAPFPVELPARLIELYTYRGDLVLDPFIGVGTTAVAAIRADRHYVGFDTDPGYVARAEVRIADEHDHPSGAPEVDGLDDDAARRGEGFDGDRFRRAALREGTRARLLAEELIAGCGFTDVRTNAKPVRGGVQVQLVATDATGVEWWFEPAGAHTSHRPGLRRTEVAYRAVGRAAALAQQWVDRHGDAPRPRLVLLTTHAPEPGSVGAAALAAVTGECQPVHAVVEMFHSSTVDVLSRWAAGGA